MLHWFNIDRANDNVTAEIIVSLDQWYVFDLSEQINLDKQLLTTPNFKILLMNVMFKTDN